MSTRPIPAVGLASALVQIIDFSINVLRKDHEIYQPTETWTSPVDNATILQAIINNLYRLTDLIDQSELKKLQDEKSEQKKSSKLSEAATQLLKHSEQVKELVESLRDALIAAQARDPKDGTTPWPTARHALLAGVWKKKDVTSTKKKLRALRREIDTSLLLALRQYLDQSAETGLPVFAKDESDSTPLRHWEAWQNAALDAIHANDWKPKTKKNVDDFAGIVDGLVVAENAAFFYEQVFKVLHFDDADQRHNAIPSPMQGSMKWIFNDDDARMLENGGFLDFLGNTRGENLFCINGLPGSGKSVLVKHLFRNERVFEYLEAWSGAAPGITAGYFFWGCGTGLQNSSVGMLRTVMFEALQDMVYGPLEVDAEILKTIFEERWGMFGSYAGGLHEFTFPELRKGFERMLADTSRKFLFMVDGLDEMDDIDAELVDTIASATKRENVKIIVASGAVPEAWSDRPSLVLDAWTKKDSQAHILHAFDDFDALKSLRRKSDNVEEMNVINTLAEKADGVFLWAKLATLYILKSLKEEDDSFTTLRKRAETLPHTLDALLAHIVDNLDPGDSQPLWKISALLEAHTHASPALITLSFALNSDEKAALAAPTKPLKPADMKTRIDEMRNTTTQGCSSLINIVDTSPPSDYKNNDPDPSSLRVTYTHRSTRKFLVSQSQPSSSKITDAGFDPTKQWSTAHLLALKALPSPSPSLPHLTAALTTALQTFDTTQIYPLTYIDAALLSFLQHLQQTPPKDPIPLLSNFPFSSTTSTPTTALDIAALLNLREYVALKAPGAAKKDVRHALEYARGVRKRVGKEGGAWVGGGRLGEEYVRDGGEVVEKVLVGYGRSVRFGGVKGGVEGVEFV